MGRKRSDLWKIPKTELEQLVMESESVVEVCKKLGVDPYNGSSKTVYKLLKYHEIPKPTCKRRRSNAWLPDDIIFIENSNVDRHVVKRHLIRRDLIPYQCQDCGNTGIHNGKKLSLQIEHKNAINNDHRLENLCFLCPNCHSQTPTYAGKKKKGPPRRWNREASEVKAERIRNTRKFHVTKEELEALLQAESMVAIGRRFGVSDNAIRKRCRVLGIDMGR